MSRLEDLENYENELEGKQEEVEASEQELTDVNNRLEKV